MNAMNSWTIVRKTVSARIQMARLSVRVTWVMSTITYGECVAILTSVSVMCIDVMQTQNV